MPYLNNYHVNREERSLKRNGCQKMQILFSPEQILSNQYVLLALGISVFVTALSYMAGEFFQMPSLKGFSKIELSELGITAVILILALLLAMPGGPFDIVASGFAVQDGMVTDDYGMHPSRVCPEYVQKHPYDTQSGTYKGGSLAYAQANYFIGCRLDFDEIMKGVYEPIAGGAKMLYYYGLLKDPVAAAANIPPTTGTGVGKGIMMPNILEGYIKLTGIEMFLAFVSTLDFGIGIPIAPPLVWLNIGGIMIFTGFSLISEANIFIVDALAAAWAAFAAQRMLLQFIEMAVPLYFLPFGVFLRAFPFSRKTGSTVVALAFAAYFVFPASILINQQVYEALQSPPVHDIPGTSTQCYATGKACQDGKECCSGKCYDAECAPPITDFSKLKSVFQICRNKDVNDAAEDWKQQVQVQQEFMEKTQDAANLQSTSPPQKTEQKLRDGNDQTITYNSVEHEMRGAGSVANIFFAAPERFGQFVVGWMENYMIEFARFAVLGMLFLVLEIVISLTVFKDFAILIGGEPRIFGISKLV